MTTCAKNCVIIHFAHWRVHPQLTGTSADHLPVWCSCWQCLLVVQLTITYTAVYAMISSRYNKIILSLYLFTGVMMQGHSHCIWLQLLHLLCISTEYYSFTYPSIHLCDFNTEVIATTLKKVYNYYNSLSIESISIYRLAHFLGIPRKRCTF